MHQKEKNLLFVEEVIRSSLFHKIQMVSKVGQTRQQNKLLLNGNGQVPQPVSLIQYKCEDHSNQCSNIQIAQKS